MCFDSLYRSRGGGGITPPVVIVGGGIAGLMTALYLAPLPCVLLTRAALGEGSATGWAQGGLAAAVGPDDDPALHAADTLGAADGLADPAVAARVAAAAPQAVADLERFGVVFDRDEAGAGGGYRLSLEAAHGRRRVVHATGDGTGRAVSEALVAAVRRTPSIAVVEGAVATSLLVEDGRVVGVALEDADGRAGVLAAPGVVLATGGVGGLYAATTNPLGARGDGLLLAARAGAVLRDLEFVQFHPTAADIGGDPMPLASEALRGEGAILIDDRGERFMAGLPGQELSPRDVVARAVFARRAAGRTVFLDGQAAIGDDFERRFPKIYRVCRTAGLDPAREPIPVRPAAHYHMGGVAVDGRGRSSVEGLWACGEVASTGLHGANRLASNSLIEGAVFARFVAEDLRGQTFQEVASSHRPQLPGRAGPALRPPHAVRRILDGRVGVVRDEDGLRRAIADLLRLSAGPQAEAGALAALMIAVAALERRESRGGHFRSDFPARAGRQGETAKSSLVTLDRALATAREILPTIAQTMEVLS
jgi:L-aspartate oxidase